MKYADFRMAIELAGEALGRGDLNPQLAKLWFDGNTVSAWDDNVAIQAACPFEFEGGVNGDMLTRLVARATGKEVTSTTKTNATIFKIGQSTLKVSVQPLEQRTFSLYEPDPNAVVEVDPKLLKPALEHVLSCVGQSLEKPEYHGVTFAVGSSDLLIYAGQPQVLVEARVPLQAKLANKFDYVVLPEKFCRQLVKHCGKKGAVLELHNATDTNSGGMLVHPNLTVFGRSMSSGQQKLGMWDYIAQHDKAAKNWINMPKRLISMLDRASIFEGEHHNLELALEVVDGRARLRITIEDGEAQLVDLSDSIRVEEIEPVTVKTNAKHLRTGAGLARISVDSERIIMQDNRKDDVLITQVAAIIATERRA
jgi:hypothetical protein